MKPIPDFIIYLTGFVSGVFFLFCSLYFTNNKTVFIWTLFFGLVFGLLTGFLYWQNDIANEQSHGSTKDLSQNNKDQFHVNDTIQQEAPRENIKSKKLLENIPIKESAVVVIPSKLDLTTSDWGKTQVVEIKNTKAAMTLYSVWIKLKAQILGLGIEDIDILSETGDEFISESFGGANVNFDFIKIDALDAQGQPCIYLLIYKIKGLESKFFKLKRKGSKGTEMKPLILSFILSGFSESPAPIVTKDGAAGLEIVPPESISMKAISMLIKKKP